jgi:ABC-type uncharacterized transport system permease subunit
MLELPKPEMAAFLLIVLVCITAAVVGILQLLSGGRKYRHLLSPLVWLAVALQAVILILRAVKLKAVPLTGLFESMIVLAMVFGLIYLFLGIAIRQVWFGSVMAWAILAMTLMAGIVAKPASNPHEAAATPWAIAHGITMILAGASITFAAASALLHLIGRRKLKRKEVMQVLGRVPNIEKLERMNLVGVRAGFVLLTIGLVSGLALASVLGTGIAAWLIDAKVICSITAWVVLAMTLLLNRLLVLKGQTRVFMTVAAFVLVLFAILVVTILDVTRHDFSRSDQPITALKSSVQK